MCIRRTQDVRVNCSLQDMIAQTPEKIQRLNYLQVGQNASGTPNTLATLDLVDGDLAASRHLKSPSAHVYNAKAKDDSWLALFIADVKVSKDNELSFYCRVIYQGSEPNQNWTSEAVPFIRDKQYTDKSKGIVVEVKRGISFECKNNKAALETGITGADTKSVSSLCPKQDFDQANNCSVCLSGVERAHLYDFGCSDRDQCADTPQVERSDHLHFELPDCVSGHTTIITVSTSPPTQSPENNGWMIAFLAVVPILFLGNVCFAVWYLKCRKGGTTKARPTPRKRPPSILDPQDDDTKPETL